MKKRITLPIIAALMLSMFLLSGCGSSTLNSIKEKYSDKGYTVTDFSKAQIADIDGLEGGFSATKIVAKDSEYSTHYVVTVYKFSNQSFAEEFEQSSSGSLSSARHLSLFIKSL